MVTTFIFLKAIITNLIFFQLPTYILTFAGHKHKLFHVAYTMMLSVPQDIQQQMLQYDVNDKDLSAIQTKHLLNSSPECYYYSKTFAYKHFIGFMSQVIACTWKNYCYLLDSVTLLDRGVKQVTLLLDFVMSKLSCNSYITLSV